MLSPARPGRSLAGCIAAIAAALIAPAPAAAAGPAFGDRELARGDRGHDVRVLQSWLTKLGYRTGVDGSFGAGTERSVERYDRGNRLPVDGKVSRGQARRMRRQIEQAAGGSDRRSRRFGERALERGDRGHDVRVLQSWLTKLGFQTAVDGVFGGDTERSVEAYQRASDLKADGTVSRELAKRLREQVEEGATQPTQPVTQVGDHVFPVQGAHRYGDGLGAGRRHQGVDLLAGCGTPVVAAQGGRVVYSGYHSAAGNYVVITGAQSGEDYVYMHLRSASSLRKGQTVETGAPLGEVGETGNASGCNLHFELWTAPGWYEGGQAYDPLPALKSWDRSDAQPARAAGAPGG